MLSSMLDDPVFLCIVIGMKQSSFVCLFCKGVQDIKTCRKYRTFVSEEDAPNQQIIMRD